jgi:hypothetical protein
VEAPTGILAQQAHAWRDRRACIRGDIQGIRPATCSMPHPENAVAQVDNTPGARPAVAGRSSRHAAARRHAAKPAAGSFQLYSSRSRQPCPRQARRLRPKSEQDAKPDFESVEVRERKVQLSDHGKGLGDLELRRGPGELCGPVGCRDRSTATERGGRIGPTGWDRMSKDAQECHAGIVGPAAPDR